MWISSCVCGSPDKVLLIKLKTLCKNSCSVTFPGHQINFRQPNKDPSGMGWCPIKLYRYLWTRSCSVTEFLQGHQNDLTMTLEFYGGGHGKGIKINKSCKRHSIGGDTVIGSGLTHYHPFRVERMEYLAGDNEW